MNFINEKILNFEDIFQDLGVSISFLFLFQNFSFTQLSNDFETS